jgi:hypothetical protein
MVMTPGRGWLAGCLLALTVGTACGGSKGGGQPHDGGADQRSSDDAVADGNRDVAPPADAPPIDAPPTDAPPTDAPRPADLRPDTALPDGPPAADASPDLPVGADLAPPGDAPGGALDAAAGVYAASLVPGGLDRLIITKSDSQRGLCFRLVLAAPGGSAAFPVQVPAPWVAESAVVAPLTAACTSIAGPSAPTAAISGTGTVRWMGTRPCLLDVEVTLSFPATPAERLLVAGLAVTGC